jgi:hypothetical protein
MTEVRHYKVDFVTFAHILGLGEHNKEFTKIHDEARMTVKDTAFMYVDRRSADGKVKGLKSYFYILDIDQPQGWSSVWSKWIC